MIEHTFRTLADVRANDVFTGVWTHSRVCSAFIYVSAVDAIGREAVPEGTRAAERPGSIVAAERAGRSTFCALVYIHTRL